MIREWFHRLWRTLRLGRSDRDLEEELHLHVELAIEDARRQGHPLEAERAARIRTGGVAQAMDALRDQRGLPTLDGVVQDLRHASRSLRRALGFATLAVVTLGFGLGATATVFSAVDALLVRPLAVEAPYALFVLRRAGERQTRFPVQFHRSLNESRTAFSDSLASFTFPVTLVASGTGTRARAAFVTSNYFEVLGVRATLGELFHSDEDRDVVVISHQFWKERLGGRTSAVGEPVRIGDAAFIVAGVTPPAFGGLQLDIALDVWIPMRASPRAVPIPSFRPAVDIVGRLGAGVSPEAAASLVDAEYRRWTGSFASTSSPDSGPALSLLPASHGLESRVREEFRASLGLLIGVCACLWMITIFNLSGLLTARLIERSQELGLRLALGATSLRLVVQLLAEVVVLVSCGLLVGLLIAAGLSRTIPRWVPSWSGIDMHVSPLVLIATIITAALAAIIVTIVQAMWLHRGRLITHVAPGCVQVGRLGRFRLSTCLVGAQLAFTVPLIVVAGLLAQTLYRLGAIDTGFARSHLLQISVEPALIGYSAERASAYYAALLERLRAAPGIADASVSSGGALSGYDGVSRIRDDGVWREVRTLAVDERYFSTMDIRILAGRPFSAPEAHGHAPAVVLNDALARRLFGLSTNAIGQVVTFDRGDAREQRIVVGVVENTSDANIRDRSTPTTFLPVGASSLLIVHARSVVQPERMMAAVRKAAISIDPNVPILAMETIETRRQKALQRERVLAATSVTIGWIALVLSAIGIFGRVSQDVVARAREIVIRSALGATPSQIANLFLRDTAKILVLSGLAGTLATFVAFRLVQRQLYGVSSTGLPMYVGVMAILALVATMATMLPLLRAWRAGESMHLLRE